MNAPSKAVVKRALQSVLASRGMPTDMWRNSPGAVESMPEDEAFDCWLASYPASR